MGEGWGDSADNTADLLTGIVRMLPHRDAGRGHDLL
ncbi:MAG: hypothetical protein KatS3mg062_1014 [Tepidiforma sp.]|nr:MAG: hypothetical protein KatS3mg062_1014 [Tepidiforma sp.]